MVPASSRPVVQHSVTSGTKQPRDQPGDECGVHVRRHRPKIAVGVVVVVGVGDAVAVAVAVVVGAGVAVGARSAIPERVALMVVCVVCTGRHHPLNCVQAAAILAECSEPMPGDWTPPAVLPDSADGARFLLDTTPPVV
jgi:hypothetical protein